MLHVHNLEKSFKNVHAVKRISFDVQMGQVLGFLGANGAGKTTTMRMIAGSLEPDGGDITVCDVNILKDKASTQSFIGYLPEGAPLYGDMTAYEFLRFIGSVRAIEPRKLQSHIDQVVSDTNIETILDFEIDTLSKGFKRRVGLASALLSDPPVLILDEPTDGLDPNQKYHIRNLIQRISKKKSIIVSTHILEEVDAICTNTVIINKGEIISYATPKELIVKSSSFNAISVLIHTTYLPELEEYSDENPAIERIIIPKSLPQWTKVFIIPKQKQYILSDVAQEIHKRGWQVAGIQSEKGNLEEVFRAMTSAYEVKK